MTVAANWREVAACRDADPDLFFPVGMAGPALRQIEQAKRICRACPVQARCLAWALDHGVTDGIWGGTTEDERRVIRRPARRMTIRHEGDDGNSHHPAGPGQLSGGQRQRVAMGRAIVKPGDKLPFAVDCEDMQFFDTQTGRASRNISASEGS